MGITGLLPLLPKTKVNIKDNPGYTVAIDTYGWIYKGAYACAPGLAMNDPEAKKLFANNFMFNYSIADLLNI
jgi:exonuclease-1